MTVNNSRLLCRLMGGLFTLILVLGVVGCESGDKNALDIAVVFLRHVPPYCPSGAQACEPWWAQWAQDLILPPRHTAQEYETVLDQLVNDYFDKSTYGQVQWNFHVLVNPDSADGWWDAPHKIEDYNLGNASLYQDGMDVAVTAIGSELKNYQYMAVIQGAHLRSGQSCCMYSPWPFSPVGNTYSTSIGDVPMLISWVSEDANDTLLAAILSHELGHLVGNADLYPAAAGQWGMGSWDLMDNDPAFNQFGGWLKLDRQWLSEGVNSTDFPCTSGSCEITVTLDPLENQGMNVLRIPFVVNSHPFEGYMVECRQKIKHDENIPDTGVLISIVDETVSQPPAQTANTKYLSTTLKPGEAFVDSYRNITIRSLDSGSGGTCIVEAERGVVVAPDPKIYQDGITETNAGYDAYESWDIWIDSHKNGWLVFPEDEGIYNIDGIPTPIGFGDPFWVGHENLIGFIIRNGGYSPAQNVIVDVYVKQPVTATPAKPLCPGPYVIGSVYDLVDTVTIDYLEDGDEYIGYVSWTPESNLSAEVWVRIRDYEGELSHSNNQARETYLYSYVEPGTLSAGIPSEIGSLQLWMPTDCGIDTAYKIFPFDVPGGLKTGWKIETEPADGVLKPGETLDVSILAQPPEDCQPGDVETHRLGVFFNLGDVYQSISGLAIRTHCVDPSQITCSAPAEPVLLGSAAPVTGSITPAGGGEPLALEYHDPAGNAIIRNPTTNSGGQYADDYIPETSGDWQVQSFWQGNNTLGQAESSVCTFRVVPSNISFTPRQVTPCRSGPSTAYLAKSNLAAGVPLSVQARSEDGIWLYVLPSDGSTSGCWVGRSTGEVSGNAESLPVRQEAAPTPTPTPSPVPFNCGQYTSMLPCLNDPRCTWSGPSCVNK